MIIMQYTTGTYRIVSILLDIYNKHIYTGWLLKYELKYATINKQQHINQHQDMYNNKKGSKMQRMA